MDSQNHFFQNLPTKLSSSNFLTKRCTDIFGTARFLGGVPLPLKPRDIKQDAVQETPLIRASKNGNLKDVRYLIEEAKTDSDQRSNFWISNEFFPIIGSALHAAVVAGKVHVVNYLLDCCKLDINAQTKALFEDDTSGGSTALRLAVSHLTGDVQKEMVTCLLDHGADWAITNDGGYQCWEITSNVELIKLLINYGVGLDSSQNANSSSIAFEWTRSLDDRSDEVVALAIDKGVDINKTGPAGLTLLMTAAFGMYGQPNVKVAEVILTQTAQPINRFDRIRALELMGAALIIDKKLEDGLRYLKMAMELRTSNETEPPISKPLMIDEAKIAFKDALEVQTMEDLENIALNPKLLKMLAHLIGLRILGLKNSVTMERLASYAFSIWFLEPQTFLNILHLILKGFDVENDYLLFVHLKKLISLSLISITRASHSVAAEKANSTFNNAMPILRKLVSLLHDPSFFCLPREVAVDLILDTIVNLAHIILHDKPLTSQESFEFKCYLHQAVRLQKRNRKNFDLFLLACTSSEFIVEDLKCYKISDSFNKEDDEINEIDFERPVSAKTISAFIEAGADINSINCKGDTGLHVLAKSICSEEGMHSNETFFKANTDSPIFAKGSYSKAFASAIRTLYKAGVPLNQTNRQGKTMKDILGESGIRPKPSIFSDD